MSSSTEITWLSLLHDKESLIEQGCETCSSITTEAAFRSHFEAICKKYKEKFIPRQLAKILPSFENIILFASAVGGPSQGLPSEGLVGLVWGASFAAIKCGCKAGAKLDGLVKLVVDLNKSVPLFSAANIARYPQETTVQSPLQDVLSGYVDADLFMVSYFTSKKPISAGFDPTKDPALKENIQGTGVKFEEARRAYDIGIHRAEQKEARDRLETRQTNHERHFSLPNHLKESVQPNDIQARFTSKRRLGGGTFGLVDEVQEMSTGALYARKHIHSQGTVAFAYSEEEVQNEVAIMQKLRHQHIATVLFYVKEQNAYSILMLPVAECDLQHYLNQCVKQGYPVSSVKRIFPWFGCLLDALAHAHKQGIKHKDIKPSNILVKDSQPYLTDFGLARDFSALDASASVSYLMEGTPMYRAPEMKPGHSRGRSADIFALGCVYSEMFTVCQEKSLEDYQEWRRGPENPCGAYAFRENLPRVEKWLRKFETDRLSKLLVHQISTMLEKNPEKRPSARDSVDYLKRDRAFFCDCAS